MSSSGLREASRGAVVGALAGVLVLSVSLAAPGASSLVSNYGRATLWALSLVLGALCGAAAALLAPIANRSLSASLAVGALLGAPCLVVIGLYSGEFDGSLGNLIAYAVVGAFTGSVAAWFLRIARRQRSAQGR